MIWHSLTVVRRTALAVAASALGAFGFVGAAPAAQYGFLPVTPTGTNTSKFTSSNGNGFINVSDTFPNGGAGAQNNNNAAIFPSQFTTLFPGTGQVQGHLAQTVYGHTSTVTFDLTNYNLSASTVFGMWNTTDEVTAPAGGSPVYRIQLIDSNNNQVNPTTFNGCRNEPREQCEMPAHPLLEDQSLDAHRLARDHFASNGRLNSHGVLLPRNDFF